MLMAIKAVQVQVREPAVKRDTSALAGRHNIGLRRLNQVMSAQEIARMIGKCLRACLRPDKTQREGRQHTNGDPRARQS